MKYRFSRHMDYTVTITTLQTLFFRAFILFLTGAVFGQGRRQAPEMRCANLHSEPVLGSVICVLLKLTGERRRTSVERA